uniref:Longin domain-containing protein n=1 Tax=Ditylenchus dipsaci TaxID=166011 RepID=A0A915DSM9_9BILA
MKLFSILIIYKNPTTNQAIVLKSAADLSSFSFFYRKNAGEFMQFTGKMIAERSAVPSRSSVKENDYLIHCFVRHDNLTGVCVTDNDYQARVAFSLLSRILEDFSQKYRHWTGLGSQMKRIAVEETRIVLHNTMQSVLERGEKLDDLVRRARIYRIKVRCSILKQGR